MCESNHELIEMLCTCYSLAEFNDVVVERDHRGKKKAQTMICL